VKHAKYIFQGVLLIATISPTFAQRDSALPQLIRHIKPAVVAVVTYDNKGKPLAQGSGFFIAPNRIITNRHVVEDASDAEVKTANGKSYRVLGIMAVDVEGDLVMLLVNGPAVAQVNPLTVIRGLPQEGERIFVIGNPLGLEGTVSDGLVSSVRAIANFGAIIQITAPISSGSSGSPVINLRGQVVGVATLQSTKGQNLNFAMPAARILSLRAGELRTFEQFAIDTFMNRRAKAARLYLQGESYMGMLFKKGVVKQEEYKDACTQALPYYEDAVEIDSENANAWEGIGQCRMVLGQTDAAIKAFLQKVRLDPNDFSAWSNLGNQYDELKQYEAAIKSYDQAFHLAPTGAMKVSIACALGDTYGYDLNDYRSALEAYKKAVGIVSSEDAQLFQKIGMMYLFLANSYSESNQHEAAIAAYQQVIRYKPDSAAGAYRFVGHEYVELKQFRDALESCKHAIRLKPDFALAYVDMAYLYLFELNQTRAAIEAGKQAVRIKPDEPYAHYYLGIAYLKIGNGNAPWLSNKRAALEEYTILKRLDETLADKLFNVIYDR
jgi:tetratricopeptide (TPR) repeat protein